jgi:hypothetical protein
VDIVQTIFHVLAGFVVLAEAMNKLERTDVLAPGLTRRERIVVLLKAAGWACIALGAGGVLVAGVMPQGYVRLGYSLMVGGFALLVVRSRVRETPAGQSRIDSDDFQRTQALRRH